MGSREIKFRGKRKLNGDWVFGSLICVGEDWDQMVPIGTEYDDIDYEMCRVISSTVGQFTGIKGKNGVEIYEGDIVRYTSLQNSLSLAVVSFGNASFRLKDKKGNDVRQWNDGNNEWYSIENIETFEIEVIGNVQDNKDLL